MARGYQGDKRRREIAKKKKRQQKLERKRSGGDDSDTQDKAYLEYLHPGGLPEELQQELEGEDESGDGEDVERDENDGE